jgi:hypothetical protein
MAESWIDKKVRIVRNDNPDREVAGTAGMVVPPEVGEVGQVTYEYPEPDLRVTVEKKDVSGGTVWFADFHRNELELVEDE